MSVGLVLFACIAHIGTHKHWKKWHRGCSLTATVTQTWSYGHALTQILQDISRSFQALI